MEYHSDYHNYPEIDIIWNADYILSELFYTKGV